MIKPRTFILAMLMLAASIIIVVGALLVMAPAAALAQDAAPTIMPTVTPWGGRRGVMPGGAAPLFPYWLAGLPIIAGIIALIVWFTRRQRNPAQH